MGQLTRPLSLGDVAMKVLETTWRGAILLTALLAVAIAIASISDLGSNIWGVRATRPLSEKVSGSAVLGDNRCDTKYPLFVTLTNNSKERIGKISFSVAIYEKDRSTNLATYGSNDFVSDAVIPPDRRFFACWEMPAMTEQHPPADLVFVVTITDAQSTQLPSSLDP